MSICIAHCHQERLMHSRDHLSYGITQCYVPPDRGDSPDFTLAFTGTHFTVPQKVEGWVDLVTTVKVHGGVSETKTTSSKTWDHSRHFETKTKTWGQQPWADCCEQSGSDMVLANSASPKFELSFPTQNWSHTKSLADLWTAFEYSCHHGNEDDYLLDKWDE